MNNVVVTVKDAKEQEVLLAFLDALNYQYQSEKLHQQADSDDDDQVILPHYATE